IMVGQTGAVLLVLGLAIGLCGQLGHGANILAVFSYSFPSPFLLVAPYMKALVRKGHQVTIISSVSHLPDIDGARHIRIQMLDQLAEDMLNYDFGTEFPPTKWSEAMMVSSYYHNSSSYILSDAGVQAMLHDKSARFDMVILQASLTDALYGFAQHYNASLVGISAFGTSWNIDYLAGNKAPSVYEPMSPSGYSHGFSLLDKLKNWVYIAEEWLIERLVYLPTQMKLYKRYFNRSSEDLYKIRGNFSLMLINHHFSLGRARSNVPNVIEVAGLHMHQPVAQFDDSLKRFLDESETSIVYLSMGMEIIAKWLPPNMIAALQQSFERLRLRVIWKFEGTLPNKSDNIYLSPMLPQRELLAHPKVKLFITHGGILSIIESAYHAMPVLCLPMYYDQFGNSERMRQAGVGLVLNLATINAEQTTAAIVELMENPSYAYNAKQMSMRLRDQPLNPLDTAVWWTEYVLRHNGAPHMRISEQDMSFMQYYNVDIASVLFGRIGLTIMLVACLSMKLISYVLKPLQMRLFAYIH
ncbi:hypothetical protein KR222_010006, partial [Zaprionus bogoriensis]